MPADEFPMEKTVAGPRLNAGNPRLSEDQKSRWTRSRAETESLFASV